MLKTETLNKLKTNITKVLNFLHNKGITSNSIQESKDYFICMEFITLCDFNFNLDKVSEFATKLQSYYKGKGYKKPKTLTESCIDDLFNIVYNLSNDLYKKYINKEKL